MYRYLIPLIAMILSGGCATYATTSGQVVLKNDNASVDVRIGDNDRALIENHYKKSKKHKKGLPPGLAKRDKLPPGLQGEPLPSGLEGKLSPLPPNCVRVRVGQDIVLMDKKTRVVFDVVYDIAR